MKIVYFTIVLLLSSVICIAQQPTNPVAQTVQSKETIAAAEEPPKEKVEEIPVLILINESSPDQMIIFDSNGTWLENVRNGSVEFEIGTGKITATLTSWKGIIKPKTPKVTKHKVKELKSISADDFSTKLEELNK